MHRDLKPANILYDDGVLKVAVFGLARSAEEDEAATMLAGTKI
jgi:serine/threonine protein kinase